MEETKKCPKCGGEMEEGKFASGFGWFGWVKGKGFLGPKEQREVKSFRCIKCSYLENYTR